MPDPEKRVIQLNLDERDAQIIAASCILACITATKLKPVGPIDVISVVPKILGLDESMMMFTLKSTYVEDYRCLISEFAGIPCVEHHTTCATGIQTHEGIEFAEFRANKIAKHLYEFVERFRMDQVNAFPEKAKPDEDEGGEPE